MRHNQPIRQYLATLCTMLVLSGIVGITMSATGCGGSGKGTTTGGPVPPPPDGNPPPPPTPGSGDQYVNLKFWKEGVNLNDPGRVCALGGLTGSKKVDLTPGGDGSYTGSFKNKSSTNVAVDFFDGANCEKEIPIDTEGESGSRLEANGVHVPWMQRGTLLRLFYLDGSGAVSTPQGEYDTAAHQDFVGCDIRLTYQGPTPAGDRDPMRIGGNVVRWSESTVMDSLGGVEYEYDTICKAGDLRRVFYREQIPGVGADQQIGRFTGIDKPREQTTHINGCDVSRSTDYQLVFLFNPGDPSPRGMNGQKLCN